MSEKKEIVSMAPAAALELLTKAGQEDMTEEQQLIREILEEDKEDNSDDMELMRIKLPAGGTNKFEMGEKGQDEEDFEAVVLVVQTNRGYWPRQGQGNPPMCSSSDGKIGKIALELDDEDEKAAKEARPVVHPMFKLGKQAAYDCSTCDLNEWGSAHLHKGGGRGKACKEMRRLLVVIKGWQMPSILSLPPTSIKNWKLYSTRLKNDQSYYFAVRTEFKLEEAQATTGDKYSVVQLMDTEKLSPEELAAVRIMRKAYKDFIAEMEVTGDDYSEEGNTGNGGGGTYIEGTAEPSDEPPPADWQQEAEPPEDTSDVLF